MDRRLAVILGLATTLALVRPAATASTPGAASPSRITVTADTMDVDSTARTVVATGRVRVTDGTATGTAERAMLYQNEGRGVLVGKARVSGPQGVLGGDEITFRYTARAITQIISRGSARLEMQTGLLSGSTITIAPVADAVVAEESVTFLSPPDTVATGRRLAYDRTRGRVVLEGRARLQNREGFIQGERIEGVDRLTRAAASGGVAGKFRDIDIRSQTAEYYGTDKKVIFIGDVEVVQTGRHLLTERVTVWYDTGKIVAEGATRVRIDPTP